MELTHDEVRRELNSLMNVGNFENALASMNGLLRHDEDMRTRLTACEAKLDTYKPICLTCGAEQPCSLNHEPNSPCTFEPTPRQLFDAFTLQRKRAEQAEARVQALEQVLTKISSYTRCDGPGCHYCESDNGHPLSTEAVLAKHALEGE